jgi:hypothetical protein
MCSGFHHLSSVFLGYTPILCVQGSITCPLCSLTTPLFSLFRVPPPDLSVPWLNPYSLCSGFHHLSCVFHGNTPILCVQDSTTCPLCSLATPLFSVFRVPPPGYTPVLCVPWLHPCSLCSGFHHLSSVFLGYTPILCIQGSTTCPLCSLATPLFSVFRVPPSVLCVPWLHPYSLCSGFHHLSSVFLGYTPAHWCSSQGLNLPDSWTAEEIKVA